MEKKELEKILSACERIPKLEKILLNLGLIELQRVSDSQRVSNSRFEDYAFRICKAIPEEQVYVSVSFLHHTATRNGGEYLDKNDCYYKADFILWLGRPNVTKSKEGYRISEKRQKALSLIRKKEGWINIDDEVNYLLRRGAEYVKRISNPLCYRKSAPSCGNNEEIWEQQTHLMQLNPEKVNVSD